MVNPAEQPKQRPDVADNPEKDEVERAKEAKQRGESVLDAAKKQKEAFDYLPRAVDTSKSTITRAWESMSVEERRQALLEGTERLSEFLSPEQEARLGQLDAISALLQGYKSLIEEESGDYGLSGFMYGFSKKLGLLRANPDALVKQIDAFFEARGKIASQIMQKPELDMQTLLESHRGLFKIIQHVSTPTLFGAAIGKGLDLTQFDCTNTNDLNLLRAEVVRILRDDKMTGGQIEEARQLAMQGLDSKFEELLAQEELTEVNGRRVIRDLYENAEEKIRGQADPEAWKSDIKDKQPDLSDAKIDQMVEKYIQALVWRDYEQSKNSRIGEKIYDSDAYKSWDEGTRALFEQYADSMGFETLGLSDERSDLVTTELIINAPLIIISGGIASLARKGMESVARAGVSWTARRIAINDLAGIWGANLIKGAAGLTFEALVFDMAHSGMRGEWIFNSPNWAKQVMSTAATLGMFKGAGRLGEKLVAKEGLLRAAMEKITIGSVRKGVEELIIKGHLEVAAMLIVSAAHNGAYSGNLNTFFDNFGEELFRAYVTIGALRTSGHLAGRAQRAAKEKGGRFMTKTLGVIPKKFKQDPLEVFRQSELFSPRALRNAEALLPKYLTYEYGNMSAFLTEASRFKEVMTPEAYEAAFRAISERLADFVEYDFSAAMDFFLKFDQKALRELRKYNLYKRAAEKTLFDLAEFYKEDILTLTPQEIKQIPMGQEIYNKAKSYDEMEKVGNVEYRGTMAKVVGADGRVRTFRSPERPKGRVRQMRLREIPFAERPAWKSFRELMQRFNPERAKSYFDSIEEISRLPTLEARKTSLLDLLGVHSQQARDHSMEVAELMHLAAKSYFPNHQNLPILAEAMRLHDIGKLLIPSKVLDGAGKLDTELKEIHAEAGALLLEALGFSDSVIEAAEFHHVLELKADGSIEGYSLERYRAKHPPKNGIDVPLTDEIKLASLFDVYEAITSKLRKRGYQDQYSDNEALDMMREKGMGEDGSYGELFVAFERFILDKAEIDAMNEAIAEAQKRYDEAPLAPPPEDLAKFFEEISEIPNEVSPEVRQTLESKADKITPEADLPPEQRELFDAAARIVQSSRENIIKAIQSGPETFEGMPDSEGGTEVYVVPEIYGSGAFGVLKEIFYRNSQGQLESALLKFIELREGVTGIELYARGEGPRLALLQSFGEHPNIMRAHERHVIDSNGEFHLLLRKAGDMDVTDFFRERENHSSSQIESLIFQVMDGMEFLWKNGVVHRDIKWSNVRFDSASGRAIIVDFGIMSARTNPQRPGLDALYEQCIMEIIARNEVAMTPKHIGRPKTGTLVYKQMLDDLEFTEVIDQNGLFDMISEIDWVYKITPEPGSRLAKMIEISKKALVADNLEAVGEYYKELQLLRNQ